MKRTRLIGLLVVFVLLLAACGDDGGETTTSAAATTTAPGFDWRRFEGDSIRLVANQNPWFTAIEPLIPEFEELTGIDVKVESYPEEQFRQRVQVELTAMSSDIDVFMTALFQEGIMYHRAGWYEDLFPYTENASITSPDYDFEDFGQGLIEGHTLDGELIGIPIMTDVEMLYYRKDILEAAGVEVPTTMDEFEAVMAAIDDPEGVRAWGSRGKGSAAVTQMSIFLYNFGADWTDDEGKAAFNTPEGLAAFEFYGDNLREYGPLGVQSMSWEELMALFQQRQLAMWNDSSGFLGKVIDPELAVDVENIGFARMPAGPGGETNSFFPWALGMSSLSEKKEQAWYFIQWATSLEIVNQLQSQGVSACRTSVTFPADRPADWVDAVRYGLEIARPKLPIVIPVAEVRDIIGSVIVTAIEGGDVAAALDSAEAAFNQAVEGAG